MERYDPLEMSGATRGRRAVTRRRSPSRALALAVALGLAAPAAASAAPNPWSVPVALAPAASGDPDLGGPGDEGPLAVAINHDGGAIIAWTTTVSSATHEPGPVEVTTRGPNGSFSSPREVTNGGQVDAAAADDQGNASAAWWSLGEGSAASVFGANGTLAGGLGTPRLLFSTPGSGAFANDAAGDAVAVSGSGTSTQGSCRRAGGQFGPATPLGSSSLVRVGIDGAGYGWLLEDEPTGPPSSAPSGPYGNSGPAALGFRECRPDGTLSSAQVISAQGENVAGGYPVVGTDTRGDLVVAWNDGSSAGAPLQAAVRPAGGSFQADQTLANDAGTALAAGLDGRADALVLFSSPSDVGSVYLPAAGVPGGVRLIPGSQTSGNATVGFDSAGNSVALWNEQTPTNAPTGRRVMAAVGAPGGAWGPAQTLQSSPPATSPDGRPYPTQPGPLRLAFDGLGRGLATWILEPEQQVFAATYDPAGASAPLVSSLRVERRLKRTPVVSFKLVEPARVRLVLERGGRGVRAAARRARYRRVLVLSLAGHRGVNRVALARAKRARPLGRGRYRLTITASSGGRRLTRTLIFNL